MYWEEVSLQYWGNSKKIDEDFIRTGMVKQIIISEIEKNPFQPREEFNTEKIGELAYYQLKTWESFNQ